MKTCDGNHPGKEARRGPRTPEQCFLCWKELNTDSAAGATGATTRAPCVHLGADTGQKIDCPSCGHDAETGKAKWRLNLFSCAVHGDCTLGKPIEGHGCCLGCKEYRPPEVYQLEVNANGIGDHLLACTVAAGWKARNPGKKLHLQARSLQWAALFPAAYDSIGVRGVEGAAAIRPEITSRGNLHFVEAVARIPASEKTVPPLCGLPAEAKEWAEQFRGCTVLAPLSLGSGAGRNWLLSHWLCLERLLAERGAHSVAICGGGDAERLKGFRGHILAGEPASRVAALMRVAKFVVSNESGMGHLAGALGVPCLVLAAQFDAAPIYAVWPSVRVLQGPLSCKGCRWSGPNFRPACNDLCACLQAIAPEAVMAELAAFLDPPDAPFVADADLNREIELHLSRLAVAAGPKVADRRATMRLFLRHLASRKNPLAVETGCQRAPLDYGAGMSTTFFGLLLKGHGGRLISLDNSPPHVEFCRAAVAGLPADVVLTDSRPWLRDYSGPLIDAFYADGMDTWDHGYQECCLEEIQAALPHLADDAIIMIDDSLKETGCWTGKGAKAVPWLESQGWRVVLDGWQVVLRRKMN